MSVSKDFPKVEEDDSKNENFDFYELTAGLSNSLTDQIYRKYHNGLSKDYDKTPPSQRHSHAHGARNDLEVEKLVEKIKEQVEGRLAKETSELLTNQVMSELKEQYHVPPNSYEGACDLAIKRIRWLMVVPFLCVFFVMISFMFVVFAETAHMVKNSMSFAGTAFDIVTGVGVLDQIGQHDQASLKKSLNAVVASILLILDLLLVGSLVIMVLVGGYENTVSRIGMSHRVPTWFGKFDIAQLKFKVAASIIIISSIQLLMSFMQLDVFSGEDVDNMAMLWTAVIHGIFVLSGIGLAYMGKLNPH